MLAENKLDYICSQMQRQQHLASDISAESIVVQSRSTVGRQIRKRLFEGCRELNSHTCLMLCNFSYNAINRERPETHSSKLHTDLKISFVLLLNCHCLLYIHCSYSPMSLTCLARNSTCSSLLFLMSRNRTKTIADNRLTPNKK